MTTQYADGLDILQNRDEVIEKAIVAINNQFPSEYAELEYVVIENIWFTDAYHKALDAKIEEAGITKEDFKMLLNDRIILNKVLQDKMVVQETTDEEVEAFFEINKGYFLNSAGENVTIDDVRVDIKTYLSTQKQQLAVQEYVQGLRDKAEIILNTEVFK